jgi:hypothetical protein
MSTSGEGAGATEPGRSGGRVLGWQIVCPDKLVRHYPLPAKEDAERGARVASIGPCRNGPVPSLLELQPSPCPEGMHGVEPCRLQPFPALHIRITCSFCPDDDVLSQDVGFEKAEETYADLLSAFQAGGWQLEMRGAHVRTARCSRCVRQLVEGRPGATADAALSAAGPRVLDTGEDGL